MADETQLESVAEEAMDSIADAAPEEAPAEGAESAPKESLEIPAEGAESAPEGQQEPQKPEPEDYVLEAGEGFNVPEDNLKSFTEACRKAGLTKAQAEAMLGWHRDYAGDVQKFQAQQESAMLAGWQKQIMEDPEIGGAQWKATVADCRRALAWADTDGSLRQLLKDTHADFNPSVIKSIARIGRAMREDRFITGKGGGSAKALEDRMWPDMHVKA